MKFKKQKSVLPENGYVKVVTMDNQVPKETEIFQRKEDIPKGYNEYTVLGVSGVSGIPVDQPEEPAKPENSTVNEKNESTEPRSEQNTNRRSRRGMGKKTAIGTEILVEKPLSKKKKKKKKYAIDTIEKEMEKWQ